LGVFSKISLTDKISKSLPVIRITLKVLTTFGSENLYSPGSIYIFKLTIF